MKSIKIENGDIVLTSKKLTMVDGLKQKIQRTKGILLTSKGELFYNTEIGLDRTEILDIKEKNISNERKKLAVIEATMNDSNVEKVEIVNIKKDRSKRTQEIGIKLKYKDYTDTTDIGGVEVE